jgi:predicted regulator of Ras-like GTPase activity (Roadblock/LC7/MglB family)
LLSGFSARLQGVIFNERFFTVSQGKYAMKSRYEAVNQVLEMLRRDNPGLDAVALVTSDGMPVASQIGEADELKVSAMAATLQGVAEQVIKELRGGSLKHVIVTSEGGTLVIKSIGKDFVLVLLVRAESKLGFTLWQAELASQRIDKILNS